MPSQGREARGQLLGTLAGLRHEHLAGAAFADALAAAEDEAAEGEAAQALLREARREHDRATKIPGELTRAMAEKLKTN